MPWYVWVIGAAILWFLILKGAEALGVADKPSGKTMEEKFRDVCRKAHYTPPEYEGPRFVSRFANVALSSSNIIHAYSTNNGAWVSEVYAIQLITSIDSQRGYDKQAGGVAWGALFIHCDNGREGRINIPSDEIDTFIATYKRVKEEITEFWREYDEATEDQRAKMNGGK